MEVDLMKYAFQTVDFSFGVTDSTSRFATYR
jgi:hypothetical protein